LLGVKQGEQQPSESKAGWSASETSKSAKSLKDIMKQEEQQLKQTPDASRPAPNSWAAKIGVGVSGSTGPSSVSTSSAASALNAQRPAVSSSSASSATKPPPQAQSKPKELPTIKGMSPEMVEWCITSMNKIIGGEFNGTGLLEILVSLESPADIREIVSETLGSVPLASQFSTEFIKRKQAAQMGGGKAAKSK